MNRYQRLVYDFQAGAKVLDPLPRVPTPLTPDAVNLWQRLITEEYHELRNALVRGDVVNIVHEQCDLLYVLYGCAIWQGLAIPNYAEVTPMIQPTYTPFIARLELALHDLLGALGTPYMWTDIIVSAGLCHTNPPEGVKLWPAFQAVHAANMAKLTGGTVLNGKVCKPEGWQPADVAAVLRAQGVLV